MDMSETLLCTHSPVFSEISLQVYDALSRQIGQPGFLHQLQQARDARTAADLAQHGSTAQGSEVLQPDWWNVSHAEADQKGVPEPEELAEDEFAQVVKCPLAHICIQGCANWHWCELQNGLSQRMTVSCSILRAQMDGACLQGSQLRHAQLYLNMLNRHAAGY